MCGSVCPLSPKQPHPQAIFQNDILKITYTNSSKISTETCIVEPQAPYLGILSCDPHFFAWVHVQCGWGSGLKETNFGRLDSPDDMKKKRQILENRHPRRHEKPGAQRRTLCVSQDWKLSLTLERESRMRLTGLFWWKPLWDSGPNCVASRVKW